MTYMTYIKDSFLQVKWVTSRMMWGMSHVTYKWEWVMSHIDEDMSTMTTRYCAYVTWLIPACHDSKVCDMTLSCATWLIHMGHGSSIWDMTHAYVTWLIRMWRASFKSAHVCAQTIISCIRYTYIYHWDTHIYTIEIHIYIPLRYTYIYHQNTHIYTIKTRHNRFFLCAKMTLACRSHRFFIGICFFISDMNHAYVTWLLYLPHDSYI